MLRSFGVSVAKHMELILNSLNRYIASSQLKEFDVFLGKNVHRGSELTKRLSSVRLLGEVRIMSRVNG